MKQKCKTRMEEDEDKWMQQEEMENKRKFEKCKLIVDNEEYDEERESNNDMIANDVKRQGKKKNGNKLMGKATDKRYGDDSDENEKKEGR